MGQDKYVMVGGAPTRDLPMAGEEGNQSLGSFASILKGSGVVLSGSNTAINRIYADDNGAALGAAGSVPDLRVDLARMLVTADQTGQKIRLASKMGQIKAYNVGWNEEQVGAVYGYLELVRAAGSMVFGGYGKTAAVIGCVENSGAMTINTNHILAGVAAISKLTSDLTQTGKTVGLLADIYDTTNWSDGTGRSKWQIGVYVPARAATEGIRIGDFASSYAVGSGLAFSASNTGIARFYGESTSDLTGAVNARTIVGRHLVVTSSGTINHESYGIIGQLCVKNTSLGHYHGGVMGTYESNTAATILTSYGVGAVIGRLGAEGTTVNSGGLLAGVLAVENTASWTNNGTIAGFATKKTAAGLIWPIGLYMGSGSVTKIADLTGATDGLYVTVTALTAGDSYSGIRSVVNAANPNNAYGSSGYFETDITGTQANHLYGLGSWINIGDAAITGGAGKFLCAQDNGIYAGSPGEMANTKVVYGMRAEAIGMPADALVFPFSLNTGGVRAHTALFECNTLEEMGSVESKTTTGKYVPMFYDANGSKFYVLLYS